VPLLFFQREGKLKGYLKGQGHDIRTGPEVLLLDRSRLGDGLPEMPFFLAIPLFYFELISYEPLNLKKSFELLKSFEDSRAYS
jgi:hypothetical protein